jgi:hypothetical protein
MALTFDCMSLICKGRNTKHRVRIVTDTLPANVHVFECVVCSQPSVRSVSDDTVNNLWLDT